jgi:hypothetical protein
MVKFARNLLATTAILFSGQSAYSGSPDVSLKSSEFFLSELSPILSSLLPKDLQEQDEKADKENSSEGLSGEETLPSDQGNHTETSSSQEIRRGLGGKEGGSGMASSTHTGKQSKNAELVGRGSSNREDIMQATSSQGVRSSSQEPVSSAKPIAHRESEPPQARSPRHPVSRGEDITPSSVHPQSTGLGHGGGETYSGSSSSPSIGGGGGGSSAPSDTVEVTPEQFAEYQQLRELSESLASQASASAPVIKAPEPIVPQVPTPAPLIEEAQVPEQIKAPAPVVKAPEPIVPQVPTPAPVIEEAQVPEQIKVQVPVIEEAQVPEQIKVQAPIIEEAQVPEQIKVPASVVKAPEPIVPQVPTPAPVIEEAQISEKIKAPAPVSAIEETAEKEITPAVPAGMKFISLGEYEEYQRLKEQFAKGGQPKSTANVSDKVLEEAEITSPGNIPPPPPPPGPPPPPNFGPSKFSFGTKGPAKQWGKVEIKPASQTPQAEKETVSVPNNPQSNMLDEMAKAMERRARGESIAPKKSGPQANKVVAEKAPPVKAPHVPLAEQITTAETLIHKLEEQKKDLVALGESRTEEQNDLLKNIDKSLTTHKSLKIKLVGEQIAGARLKEERAARLRAKQADPEQAKKDLAKIIQPKLVKRPPKMLEDLEDATTLMTFLSPGQQKSVLNDYSLVTSLASLSPLQVEKLGKFLEEQDDQIRRLGTLKANMPTDVSDYLGATGPQVAVFEGINELPLSEQLEIIKLRISDFKKQKDLLLANGSDPKDVKRHIQSILEYTDALGSIQNKMKAEANKKDEPKQKRPLGGSHKGAEGAKGADDDD